MCSTIKSCWDSLDEATKNWWKKLWGSEDLERLTDPAELEKLRKRATYLASALWDTKGQRNRRALQIHSIQVPAISEWVLANWRNMCGTGCGTPLISSLMHASTHRNEVEPEVLAVLS
jgi:hypothetical protein